MVGGNIRHNDRWSYQLSFEHIVVVGCSILRDDSVVDRCIFDWCVHRDSHREKGHCENHVQAQRKTVAIIMCCDDN